MTALDSKIDKTLQSFYSMFPGGVNSPVRALVGLALAPLIVNRAYGDTFETIDEKRYVDFCLSWGALIHGHAHPYVNKCIKDQLDKGTSYGINSYPELLMAENIQKAFPHMEQMRFTSSGTEATMAAIRLARGVTKKPFIIKFIGNYHGSSEALLVKAGSGVLHTQNTASSDGVLPGAVENTLCLPYNDISSVKEIFNLPQYKDSIAAIIMEPIAGNMGVVPSSKDFIRIIRKYCTKYQALLIFDEVITGFRMRFGGMEVYYDVEPDLTCLGKIMGGGLPAACFGGKKEWMRALAPEGQVYQGGTLSGNPAAMVAGCAALNLLEEDVYKQLQAKIDRLCLPIEAEIKEKNWNVCLQRVGSMFTLFFGTKAVHSMEDLNQVDLNVFKKYFHHMLERGIYISPSQYETCFISSVHSNENLDITRELILEFLSNMY